ncbi:hypothetical protein CPT_Sansa57 [Caulobacter phage Sansa]|uniref:DUF4326 domain-containing protein n=1 Tax=Caulobacter phage Sansa TaxID=1675600 RepID=A0A0K1LLT4_9CAUD|nr:hypothetical protein HOR07_gp057 [Caulobacter phage Sansa]AKU43461.1 hypothetical protein CPT_Sansa57 [Caulobacter phage Sansa]
MPPNSVRCTRPGPFGNPFVYDPKAGITVTNLVAGKWSSRPQVKADVVRSFETHVLRDNPTLYRRICEELPGKDLGCFCREDDPDCHVEVLLRLANPKGEAHG